MDQLYPTVTKPLNPRIGEGWSSETHTSSHKHFPIHQSCPIWMAHYFVGKQPRRPPYDMVGGQTSADLSLVALAFSPPTWWGSCCPSGQQPPDKVHSLSYAVLRFLVLLHVVTICYNLVLCFSGFWDLGRRRQSFSKCPGLFAAHGCIPCRVKEFNKVLLRKKTNWNPPQNLLLGENSLCPMPAPKIGSHLDHVRDPQAHRKPFKNSWAKRLLQVLGVLPFEELDAVPLGLANGRLDIRSDEVFKHSAYVQLLMRFFGLRITHNLFINIKEHTLHLSNLILFTYLRWSCETEVSESCRFLVIGKWSPAFQIGGKIGARNPKHGRPDTTSNGSNEEYVDPMK